MANSAALVGGETGHIDQYNNLRKDVLDIASGHRHSGAVDGGMTLFATPVALGVVAFEAIYQATYDCFICIYMTGVGQVQVKVENATPPTQVLLGVNINSSGGCIFPVKKGDYWQLHVTTSVSENINGAYQIRIGA